MFLFLMCNKQARKKRSTIKGTKTNFCSPQTKKHTDRIVNHALSVGVLTYKTNVSLVSSF